MQRMRDIFLNSVDFLQIFDNIHHQFASLEVVDADDLVSEQNGGVSTMWAEVERKGRGIGLQ